MASLSLRAPSLTHECSHSYAHDSCPVILTGGPLSLSGTMTSGRTQILALHLLTPCCTAHVHWRREPRLARCSECSKVYDRPAYREAVVRVSVRRGVEITYGPNSQRADLSPVGLFEYWADWCGSDPLTASIVANSFWDLGRAELNHG